MYEKNQVIDIEIVDMSDQAQGIGKAKEAGVEAGEAAGKAKEAGVEAGDVAGKAKEAGVEAGVAAGKADGFTVFVPGTLPGDKVRCRLTKVKKRYAFGVVEEMIEPSEDRIEKMCPYAGDCGGCAYAEYDIEAQRALKTKQIRDKLVRLAGIEEPVIRPMLAGEDLFAYRNKAVMPISTGGNIKRKGGVIENLGEPAVGFNRVRTHDVVDCETCMLQSPAAMAAAAAMREFMTEDNITAWDEKWKQGLMRQMTVKTARGTGEVMVICRINGKGIPNVEKLIGMMDDSIAEAGFYFESFYIDNDKDLKLIAGRNVITEQIGGITFEISPRSFYQVNPEMMAKLYDKVREYAALDGDGVLLDLYCGVGSIGLWCAAEAGYIIGIEREHQAVLDANRNAVINGIVNARYIEGAAEEVMQKVVSEEADDELTDMIRNAEVAVIDPPRAGCDSRMIEALAQLAPERIVYVSCDPATMARDIKSLCEKGYEFAEATPADMFPWTRHVETVVLLSRKAD